MQEGFHLSGLLSDRLETDLIRLAFQEDFGPLFSDPTTMLLCSDSSSYMRAHIVSKEVKPIIFCGQKVIDQLIAQLALMLTNRQYPLSVISHVHDGESVSQGTTCATLHGSALFILMLERTLLNFLQRLCAIATRTQQFVKRISHTKAIILDTRKTSPGFRSFEKYAVRSGGGANHRMGLYDALMIKDTHTDQLGGMASVISRLPLLTPNALPVIVEVRSNEELDIVLKEGQGKVTRVLFDNLSISQLKEGVSRCYGVFQTEASGNVDLNRVASIAETGVDFISVGQLTHSAGSVDLSMWCETQ